MKNKIFLKYAAEVLKSAQVPLAPKQIWDSGSIEQQESVDTESRTPSNTMGRDLNVDVKKESSIFARIFIAGRPYYYLKERESNLEQGQFLGDYKEKIEEEERQEEEKDLQAKDAETGYDEKSLHPLLRFFVETEEFSRGKRMVTKTINESLSKSKGYGEWTNPDIVGFCLSFGKEKSIDNWEKGIIGLNKKTESNGIKFYSFELKKKISKATYRESFFQAVSNSSWAHEGYLVAADLDKDNVELMSELGRLCAAFGIGVIHLVLGDFDSSRVLFPAKPKTSLDWATINKLYRENDDYKAFIDNAKDSFETGYVINPFNEELIENPEEYIKGRKMA